MQTVAVAVSGGVDSLCALLLLRRAGHKVLALHGRFLPEGPEDAPLGLYRACAALDVPLHVVDLRQAFAREVLTPFAAAYAAGRTPNPCARCNRAIKFGALLDAALALGADRLATGHYARLVPGPDRSELPLLATAQDAAKDQSYFLSLVPRQRLARAQFPLAGQDKTTTRALVAAAGLTVPLPGESQDICFVPTPEKGAGNEAYRPFLESRWRAAGLDAPEPGPVLLADAQGGLREIGRHRGLWRYTEGQRKGLGIAYSEPLYVLRKDRAATALVVGPRHLLGMRWCRTARANLLLPPEFWPEAVLVRLRYRQRPASAQVRVAADGGLHISLAEPLFPSAPGQVAAVYDPAGRVLAAGVVTLMG